MLLYATLGTDDVARATAFWDPIMASLGHPKVEGLGEGDAVGRPRVRPVGTTAGHHLQHLVDLAPSTWCRPVK